LSIVLNDLDFVSSFLITKNMKTLHKNLLLAASGTFLCLFLAVPAGAQHTSGGGGGGGGSHSSGGGGGSTVSSARPSGGGGSVSSSRPSAGSTGVSRPSAGVSRPSGGAGAGQRSPGVQRPTYVYRNGAIVRNTNPNSPGQGVSARGNYGYPQRVGVAATGAYRTAPRVGYGAGSYWGSHGYYHLNHGYYNSLYAGRLGYQCRNLPYSYYPFFWGDDQYFFCDGLFYTYDNEQYTVVEPPIGAEVTTLPDNAQSIVINGQQYYECNGVYYQPYTKDDGTVVYVVAGKDGTLNTDSQVQDNQPQGPQLGDIVSQLPPDCKKIKLNGDKLFVSPDGIYYKEQVDANGVKTYKIVGLPSDEPDTTQN
jgi:hypothetical protein